MFIKTSPIALLKRGVKEEPRKTTEVLSIIAISCFTSSNILTAVAGLIVVLLSLCADAMLEQEAIKESRKIKSLLLFFNHQIILLV